MNAGRELIYWKIQASTSLHKIYHEHPLVKMIWNIIMLKKYNCGETTKMFYRIIWGDKSWIYINPTRKLSHGCIIYNKSCSWKNYIEANYPFFRIINSPDYRQWNFHTSAELFLIWYPMIYFYTVTSRKIVSTPEAYLNRSGKSTCDIGLKMFPLQTIYNRE